jgi:hypothetical protein
MEIAIWISTDSVAKLLDLLLSLGVKNGILYCIYSYQGQWKDLFVKNNKKKIA